QLLLLRDVALLGLGQLRLELLDLLVERLDVRLLLRERRLQAHAALLLGRQLRGKLVLLAPAARLQRLVVALFDAAARADEHQAHGDQQTVGHTRHDSLPFSRRESDPHANAARYPRSMPHVTHEKGTLPAWLSDDEREFRASLEG